MEASEPASEDPLGGRRFEILCSLAPCNAFVDTERWIVGNRWEKPGCGLISPTLWALLSLLEPCHGADLFLLLSAARDGLRDNAYRPAPCTGLQNTVVIILRHHQCVLLPYNVLFKCNNWGILGCWRGLYVMAQFSSTPVNELFGFTAVCYAGVSAELLVRGWELSAPPPEAVVPRWLEWHFAIFTRVDLLIQITCTSPAGVSVGLSVFVFTDRRVRSPPLMDMWCFFFKSIPLN